MDDLEFTALIEEYKICREDAAKLESNIWKTSTILGLSSAAGLFLKITSRPQFDGNFDILLGISALIITASIVWWRLSRRWWSIQKIKYIRMNDLETKLNFRQNSLIGLSDLSIMSDVKYDQDLILSRGLSKFFSSNLFHFIPDDITPKPIYDKSLKNYEYRGNQPAVKLLVLVNVLIWSFLVFLQAFHNNQLNKTLILGIAYYLVVLYFWRKP